IQIQGFGIVFSTLTGIPYPIACLCFMILLIFTCMGGFESVAATDTLNASLILVGVIAAMIAVLTECGGVGAIFANFATTTAPVVEGGEPLVAGILGSNWGTLGASVCISYFLSNCFGSTVAPHWVSRFMAPRNAKTAALQMFLVMVILIAVFCPLILIGMGGKMIMPSLPEGITSDYMFPRLIMDHIHPVLGALALTAICAAAVSTANSMLLHCSTSLIYDIKRVLQGGEASEAEDAKTTKQLRITILSLGVIAVICAIGQFSLLADGFTYVYGAFGSMFFASIWLGLYVKRMNNAAAFASMLTGLAAYIYCMVAGAPFGLPAFIVSCGLSLVAAAIGILVGKKPPLEAYESYFSDNVSAKTLEVAHKIRKDVV
ncbi:MAG: sodium:solute symporter family protein, partial [Oscillospiraceae bacterium]